MSRRSEKTAPAAADEKPVAAAPADKKAPAAKAKHADPAPAAAAAAAPPPARPPRGPPPAGGAGGINVDKIADADVRRLKQREQELKAELAELKNEIRVLSDEKDAVMRKLQPAQDKFFETMDKNREELLRLKDATHVRLDQLKIQQNTASTLRDQLRVLDFDFEPLGRDIADLRKKTGDLQTRLQANTERRARLLNSLPFKTISEVDTEIAKLDKQIAQSTKKGEAAVASALSKQKSSLEKIRRDIQASYEIDDVLIRDRAASDAAQQQLQQKEDRRREIEERKKRIREQLADLPQFQKEFDTLRATLQDVSRKLDAARQQQREQRPNDSRANGLSEKLGQLRNRRDALNAELDSVVASVPHVTVKHDPGMRGDIIGRGGATLAQLQADFGVAIDVDGPNRSEDEVTIVGGKEDCERAAEAIKQMLAGLAANRLKKTISFDPSQARGLIGARGANIDRIQRVSGAQVKLDSATGVVTLTGSEEALAAATTLIEEHFFDNAEAAMKYPADMFDIVVGKGGATVRRIEEESGCKKVKIDREGHVISMFGSKDAVEKAKQAYTQLLHDMSSSAFTMRVDERMVRLIIGKGGQTINDLTKSTGAMIDIKDGGVVVIRGPKDAVAHARTAIEDLTRRDEVKVPFDPVLLRKLITPVIEKQTVDGNEVEVEGLCPLEDIRNASACDQVSAIRSEGKIVLRGKRECVSRARELLEQLFREWRAENVVVQFPEVLLPFLTRRGAAGEPCALDVIIAEVPGLIAVDADKATATITVAGQRGTARPGADKVQALLDSVKNRVLIKKVPSYALGGIIGPMGATINDLQKRTKCDINVIRDRTEVQVFGPTEEAAAEAMAAVTAIVDAETARGPPARR